MKPLREFWAGVTTSARGFELLRKHRGLRFWALAPWSVMLIFVLGFFITTWVRLETFVTRILQMIPFSETVKRFAEESENLGWFRQFLGHLIWGTATFLLKTFVLLTSGALGFLLAMIICAFLWELLAEKTADRVAPDAAVTFSSSRLKRILVSAVREVFKSLALVLGPIFLWALTFIPILGPIIGVVCAPFLTAGIFGYNLVDFTMSARELPIQSRFRWARSHLPFLLGLGLIASVPLLNLVLIPVLIPGAAQAYLKRRP